MSAPPPRPIPVSHLLARHGAAEVPPPAPTPPASLKRLASSPPAPGGAIRSTWGTLTAALAAPTPPSPPPTPSLSESDAESASESESVMGDFVREPQVQRRLLTRDEVEVRLRAARQRSIEAADAETTAYAGGRVAALHRLLDEHPGQPQFWLWFWWMVAGERNQLLNEGNGPFETAEEARLDADAFLDEMAGRRRGVGRSWYQQATTAWAERAFQRGCCSADDELTTAAIALQVPDVETPLTPEEAEAPPDPRGFGALRFDTAVPRTTIAIAQPWNGRAFDRAFASAWHSFVAQSEDSYATRTAFVRQSAPALVMRWNRAVGRRLGAPRHLALPLYSETIYCGHPETQCWGVTVALYAAPRNLDEAEQLARQIRTELSESNDSSLESRRTRLAASLARLAATIPSASIEARGTAAGPETGLVVHVNDPAAVPTASAVADLVYDSIAAVLDEGLQPDLANSELWLGAERAPLPSLRATSPMRAAVE